MDLNLKDKVALVIASSQGLGKAVAVQLAKEGARVMISSRNMEKLQQVQKELHKLHNVDVEYCQADITKLDDIKSLVNRTRNVFGKIDILVNNAGGPPGGFFEDLSDEEWENH